MKNATWIVLGLVVVLGVLYFLNRENQVSVGVKQLKLPAFTVDKVDRVEIQGKELIELVKRSDGWKVKLGDADKAREVRADVGNVESSLDAAQSLRSSHYVTNLKDKYDELGFSKEAAVTVKIWSNDKLLWSLILGKNASGTGRYAKLPDDDDVFLVRGSFWSLTRNSALDFRDREIWQAKEGEIDRFSITKVDGSEIALVKEGDDWKFDASQKGLTQGFRVDKSALHALVRAGTGLRANGFVDEMKPMSPALTLKAGTKDVSYSLELFPHTSDKYLARRAGDDQLYEVTKQNFDRLNVSVETLRDLSVMNFDKNTVKEIVMKHNNGRIVVKKLENQWQIVEPKSLPEKFEFDANAVEDVLTLLSNLNGERIATAKDVAQSVDWQKKSLIELTTDKGDQVRLFAGKTKTSKDKYLVRGNIDQEIYVVNAARLSSLFSGLNAFKKEEFELPPIDEHTKGFESLPVEIQRKLLKATKEKMLP